MKKGFTLIELLAVIVILAVLALIATPIVLNIIDDSKKNATLRSSENYIKAIEFSIAKSVMENKRLSDGTYPIMANGSICIGTLTGSTCSDTLVVEVSGETPESGNVTIKSRKIDSYEFTYKSGFVIIDGVVQDGQVVHGCIIQKQDSNKYSIGDVVTCYLSETTDKFYVIEEANLDATHIKMLTEKNININTYRQSDNAGIVNFSETSYWFGATENLAYVYDSNSILYDYLSLYESYLKENNLEDISASLVSFEQTVALNCYDLQDEYSIDWSCEEAPSWLYSTTYWLGSKGDTNITGDCDHVLYMSNSGNRGWEFPYEGSYGIRPVITISTNSIKTN